MTRSELASLGGVLAAALFLSPALAAAEGLRAGVASRDITPSGPIWLSGYAARDRSSERADGKLLAQAVALADASGERVVIISLDNCEVSREFMAPVREEVEKKLSLSEGALIVVSSHTHSAPCLSDVLSCMFFFPPQEAERVAEYSRMLRQVLVDLAGEALADLKAARVWWGRGRAGFAMNRRVYRDDRVDFGENPEGPVDRDVPVLKVTGDKGEMRAILFGYACHGTTIGGEEFYAVSGDYMGYAREHLEAAFPGARALYLTGCGADSNPSPRGRLQYARQHGLELAGAVTGALQRPLAPVEGKLSLAFARVELPLAPAPSREKLEEDTKSSDRYVQSRARKWLGLLDGGRPLPSTVSLPLSVLRIGDDLTMFFIAGETVVDYGLRLKRLYAKDEPWVVGYAYEIPCYIPSQRILNEGGYEAESSLIYYGIYGPLLPRSEGIIFEKLAELAGRRE